MMPAKEMLIAEAIWANMPYDGTCPACERDIAQSLVPEPLDPHLHPSDARRWFEAVHAAVDLITRDYRLDYGLAPITSHRFITVEVAPAGKPFRWGAGAGRIGPSQHLLWIAMAGRGLFITVRGFRERRRNDYQGR